MSAAVRIKPETYPCEPYKTVLKGLVLDYRIGYRALRGDEDLGLHRSRDGAQQALSGASVHPLRRTPLITARAAVTGEILGVYRHRPGDSRRRLASLP